MKQRTSLSRRFTLLVTGIFITVMTAFSIVVYYNVQNITMIQISSHARGLAESISALIRRNADEYMALMQGLDTSDPLYVKMCGYLGEMRNFNSMIGIYSERMVDGETIQYILSADAAGSEYFTALGSYGKMTEARAKAYKYSSIVYSDTLEYANRSPYITVFTPIIHPKTGALLGLVGVEVSAEQANGKMTRLIALFALTLGMLIVIVFIVVYNMAEAVVGPMSVDALTDVYNRRFFERFLKKHIRQLRSRRIPLSVMMLDLDLFKGINDMYGHPFGDQVLKQTARIIGLCLRKTDCLARYGGEEFVVALPYANTKATLVIAERIRQAVEENSIYYDEGDIYIYVTLSIGVAELDAALGAAALVENADKALYVAKKTRNQVAIL